jgi:RNA polymerase sigma-70 factor (ECF subfamily)
MGTKAEVMTDEPAELLERSLDGSAAAFSGIVRHYQSRVRAYLSRFVRDQDVVEDLAQDTFVRAYRGLANFRKESSFGVWLLGIARNLALMHLREESRRRVKESELLREALSRWLAEQAEREDLGESDAALAALERCLEALPEHSADLVENYYYRGRSASDLARDAGKKESAVWMTLMRVRELLKRCIQGRLAGAGA